MNKIVYRLYLNKVAKENTHIPYRETRAMSMTKTSRQKLHKLERTSMCGGSQGKDRASAGAGGCWEASQGKCPASKEEKDVGQLHRGKGGEEKFSLQDGLMWAMRLET